MAMFTLARLGERVDVDLWHYQTRWDNRSIQGALNFLVPYVETDKKWPYEEIKGVQPSALYPLLWQAAIIYGTPEYQKCVSKLIAEKDINRQLLLLYPPKSPNPDEEKTR
jgi:hypothetical protein